MFLSPLPSQTPGFGFEQWEVAEIEEKRVLISHDAFSALSKCPHVLRTPALGACWLHGRSGQRPSVLDCCAAGCIPLTRSLRTQGEGTQGDAGDVASVACRTICLVVIAKRKVGF